jgi:hypothetical protein
MERDVSLRKGCEAVVAFLLTLMNPLKGSELLRYADPSALPFTAGLDGGCWGRVLGPPPLPARVF